MTAEPIPAPEAARDLAPACRLYAMTLKVRALDDRRPRFGVAPWMYVAAAEEAKSLGAWYDLLGECEVRT
jgi:hypothetical protein